MKTIQLDQEFLDKIVLDELKEYRKIMLGNMVDYEDLNRHTLPHARWHLMVIAALDIIINQFTA